MMNIHCYCLIRPDFSSLGEMSWLSSWSRREERLRPGLTSHDAGCDGHRAGGQLRTNTWWLQPSVVFHRWHSAHLPLSHLLDRTNKVQHWGVWTWGCQHFSRGLFMTRESFMTKVTRFEFPINVKFHFPNKFIKAQGFNLSNLSYLPEWSDQW